MTPRGAPTLRPGQDPHRPRCRASRCAGPSLLRLLRLTCPLDPSPEQGLAPTPTAATHRPPPAFRPVLGPPLEEKALRVLQSWDKECTRPRRWPWVGKEGSQRGLILRGQGHAFLRLCTRPVTGLAAPHHLHIHWPLCLGAAPPSLGPVSSCPCPPGE